MPDYSAKTNALQELICEMLRGYPRELNHDELREYTERAGIALHNIPLNIESDTPLSEFQMLEIDCIDPTASDGKWGDWVIMMCAAFTQPVPDKVKTLEELDFTKPWKASLNKNA